MKDALFLLKPGFEDDGATWFCPGCARVEGMLSFFPQLRDMVDVHYVDFERPRPAIVAALDEEHQSAPVLVLGRAHQTGGVDVQELDGKRFIDDSEAICQALAARHGVPAPHP